MTETQALLKFEAGSGQVWDKTSGLDLVCDCFLDLTKLFLDNFYVKIFFILGLSFSISSHFTHHSQIKWKQFPTY